MRERLIHQDRWIGAFKGTKSPIQIVWADGDPVAIRHEGPRLPTGLEREWAQRQMDDAGLEELPIGLEGLRELAREERVGIDRGDVPVGSGAKIDRHAQSQ